MAIIGPNNITSKDFVSKMGMTYSTSTSYNATVFFTEKYGIKWARFKPVINNSVIHHDPEDEDPDNPNWWLASDGYCGLSIPKTNSTSKVSGVADPNTLWTIVRPSADGSTPLRLGDFAGYVNGITTTDYVHPIKDYWIGLDSGTYVSDAEYLTQLFFVLNNNTDTRSLDITDFGTSSNALKNWYVGAVLTKDSDSTSATTCRSYFSTDLKLTDTSDGGYGCYDSNGFRFGLPPKVFTHSNSPKYGTYTIYLALFSAKNLYDSSSGNISLSTGYYVPLPVEPVTFELKEETASEGNLSIVINSLSLVNNVITANATITNKNSTSWSFKYDTANASGCYFIRVRTQRQYDDDYDSFTNANTSTTVTVAANSSSTFDAQSNYSYVSGYYTVYVEMCWRDSNGNITWTKGANISKQL